MSELRQGVAHVQVKVITATGWDIGNLEGWINGFLHHIQGQGYEVKDRQQTQGNTQDGQAQVVVTIWYDRKPHEPYRHILGSRM
jgi:hypothetical protein